jgi:hypothetical protein
VKITGTGLVCPRLGLAPAQVPAREARRLTRAATFALGAAREALGAASVEATGIALGSGYGSSETTRLALEGLFERADLLSPSHFVASVRHDAASAVARILALRGPSAALSARRLSFEQALGWSIVQLRRERARSMLVVGADEASDVLARSLRRGRLRGKPLEDGEGAGALLVERDDSGAPALARTERFVEGAGSADDLVAAIRRALGGRFDAVYTDEDGSARRRACAERVASGLACEKIAVAARTGHVAAGGALVAVEAVRAVAAGSRERVLVYAREVDGAYFAYALERP